MFYDTSGHEVARKEYRHAFLATNSAAPTYFETFSEDSLTGGWMFDTARGEDALSVYASDAVAHFKIIGTTALLRYGSSLDSPLEKKPWLQWDLTTTKPGPSCKVNLDTDYVGSDGRVVVTDSDDHDHTVGIDLLRCQTLWQFPKFRHVWKLGTGLVEENIDDDLNNTLTWLRAPS